MLKFLRVSAVAAALFAANAASAAVIPAGSSFTLGGVFSYVVPLALGSDMDVDSVNDPITAKLGAFSGLDDGTYSPGGDQTLNLSTGPESFSFSLMDGGDTFTFTFAESVNAVLNTFFSLKQPDLDGLLTVSSTAYDDTPGVFSFAGTTETASGAGTFSLTIVTSDVPAIPVPAALPMLLGALGLLGAGAARKRLA